MLAILCIIKDLLAANPRMKEPTKSEFYLRKSDITKISEKFLEGLVDLNRERIRGVTKSMWGKH